MTDYYLRNMHRPSDCVLLIGIPVNMNDYDDHREGLLESDFLARCCPGRVKFYNEVHQPVKEALSKITKYGCEVHLKIEEEEIKNAFKKKVVLIFTHWDKNCVEVCGRMIPDDIFASFIPRDFHGIIDICACQPIDNLVVNVKKRAPNSTVKCTLMKITPAIWIEIIRLNLYLLYRHQLDYKVAVILVLKQIFKKYNRENNLIEYV